MVNVKITTKASNKRVHPAPVPKHAPGVQTGKKSKTNDDYGIGHTEQLGLLVEGRGPRFSERSGTASARHGDTCTAASSSEADDNNLVPWDEARTVATVIIDETSLMSTPVTSTGVLYIERMIHL